MKNKFLTRKAGSMKTNFIGAFDETVLTECADSNRPSKSTKGNEYSVFETKAGRKVGIMSGELEDLHERDGGILTDVEGNILPDGDVKIKLDVLVNAKVLIGRGDDGNLYSRAA